MSGRGGCYAVWGDAVHFDRARRAAGYARRAGHATCLVSDDAAAAASFDRYVPAPADWLGLRGLYRKYAALALSPFAVTLLTDSDLLVTGGMGLAFDGAERWGLALAYAPGQVIEWNGREWPHYNTGLVGFRGNPADLIGTVLDYKARIGSADHDDEAAFSVGVHDTGRAVFALPSVFNLVASGWVHPRKVRGWHSHHPPQSHLVSVLDAPDACLA